MYRLALERKYAYIALRNDCLADISLSAPIIKKLKRLNIAKPYSGVYSPKHCGDHKILIFSSPFSAALECRIHIAEWKLVLLSHYVNDASI
jgi:hypothetical protein